MQRALDKGQSGVGRLTLWKSPLAKTYPVAEYNGDLEAEIAADGWANERLSRSDKLAVLATLDAIADSGLDPNALRSAGCYFGQSVCGTFGSETYYVASRAGKPLNDHSALSTHQSASSLDALGRRFGLSGPISSFMTACSSSANAIGLAALEIETGHQSIMLAGGTDSLSQIAYNGFCSLQVVSPDGPRPFDENRSGMCVGEGAAVLILESESHARQRGATIYAFVSGYGHSCDAHHLTAPHPEGHGAIRAMQEALTHAGLTGGDIDYVNAHGTATRDNDATESIALSKLFGDHRPSISSTKRYFGHTLGAAGAIEAVICIDAMMRGVLPANLGLETPIAGSDLDILRESQTREVRHALSNSFGFGGNNAALVFSREMSV